MKRVKFIPYECGAGASAPGCENGPHALWKAGIAKGLGEWLRTPEQHEVLKNLSPQERKSIVLEAVKKVSEDVASVLGDGNFPLTIGGDHSIAAGSIRGLAEAFNAYGNIGLLWIDAHPDLNTLQSSESGALHGMSLSSLIGEGQGSYAGIFGNKPVLNPNHVCVFGARSLDGRETQEFFDEIGLRVFQMLEIQDRGLEVCWREALEVISQARIKAISFDLDSLSPDFELSTGTPVSQGFAPEDILPLLGELNIKEDFDFFELVEFNPALGDAQETAGLCKDILEAALK